MMKFAAVSVTALSAMMMSVANAQTVTCEPEIEIPIAEGSAKMSFTGFQPSVNRYMNEGVGNKIILKGFSVLPKVETVDGSIVVTAGDPCDVLGGSGEGLEGDDPTASSAVKNILGLSAPLLLGRFAGFTPTLITTAMLMSSTTQTAHAQSLQCDLVPIEVDIFVDGVMADELVAMETQTGQFSPCEPETTYWEHMPEVFGGYKGCVGERALYPCPNDASSLGDIYQETPIIWDGTQCVETGYTMQNRTFVIAGGNPYDTYELVQRTGLNPVLNLPYMKGPYPRYSRGSDPRDGEDESNNARIKAFQILEYIGAWSYETLIEDWDVTITEGAEQGMVHLWAGKALEMAQTTCNRDIYVICEAPCYGYSTGDAAEIANRYSSTFYNSTECLCAEDDSCLDKTVTITYVGWLPNTDYPVATGGDNMTYAANSMSMLSPWIENIVFPENPSGVIKSRPIIGDSNRVLCDGVYLWPMYLGARDFKIPFDELPDCAGWAFSISKIWSAASRAGWITYKKEPAVWNDAIVRAIGNSQSFTHGLLSDWTWQGQQQIMDIIMAKPLDDDTSWIGAYTNIIREKWDYILEAFENCPVIQPTNPYSGAYVWFAYQPGYLGLSGTGIPSFFREVIGVQTVSRSNQFRGSDPADFYGEGYSIYDFTRLNLYRDIRVYEEVGRRGKLVCNDFSATVGENTISVDQWVAVNSADTTRRRRHLTKEDRKRHLLQAAPDLTNAQLEYVIRGQDESDRYEQATAKCAPDYTTQCLHETVGFLNADDSTFM